MEIKSNMVAEEILDHTFQEGGYLNFEDFCDTKQMSEEEVEMLLLAMERMGNNSWNAALTSGTFTVEDKNVKKALDDLKV